MYEKIGGFLEKCILQNPYSDTYKNATIDSIHICDDGLFKVVFHQFGLGMEVWVRNIHLNLGGTPKTLKSNADDRYVHSHDVLTEQSDRLMGLFDSRDSLNIAIIGNSHSAMTVLSKLNERFGAINSPKYTFDMYGKSNVKLY